MNIRFPCPGCETPGRLAPLLAAGDPPSRWQCPHCGHTVELAGPTDPALPACALCGNPELYRKKNFPHNLGMGLLVVAFATSTVTYLLYLKVLTWTILIGTAVFDGLLYLLVSDVVVCYRCNAHHSGIALNPEHRAFELTVHERYRQERLRRAQIQGDRVPQ